ncbi:MAG TPA: hypothetical protein VNQ55_04700 [Parapedobacter sp.]|nr:hypothetical protein [Parapedobacter sp.]
MAGRVLITQGIRPLAQRVGKLLQGQYEVKFGSAEEVPQVLLQRGNYIQFPGVNTVAFEHELLRICLDNGIDVLIPLGEKEIGLLARAQQLFAEYDIAIWIPDATQSEKLSLIRNPDRPLPLLVLDRGVTVAGEQPGNPVGALSGVFTQPTPAAGLALCCIAD